MRYGKLWLGLILAIVASFAVLGYFGRTIFQQMPPIPRRVITTDGRELFTGADILEGQNVWQAIGGQELGTVWGHGAAVAPDWSADFLHREAFWILEHWAESEHASSYNTLSREFQAGLRARLQELVRPNTFDPRTRDLVLPPLVAQAIQSVGEYYAALFGDNPQLKSLRNAYAMPAGMIHDTDHQAKMNAFFFWTAWACVTNRPGEDVSYTQNWPPEDLVGNHPRGGLLVWSGVSLVLLLAGIGALGFYYAVLHNRRPNTAADLPERDPLLGLHPTPSMKSTVKYFWLVSVLFILQVVMGAVTAHYGVVGADFYGFPLSRWLPYSVARTWHLQLGMFWIATSWLAAALFIAPAVAGREPPFQRLGVNLLFFLLLATILGSLGGQWWGLLHSIALNTNFWFGHMGLEYVEQGRFWAVFLLGVLLFWFLLLLRALRPALRRGNDNRHLLGLFLLSSAAIALFYGAALMWRRQTNLAQIEYWRWWVVHLWLEGFFEVFATVLVAFLFTRMGLLAVSTATSAVFFSMTIFLAGAIIGTFQHLYFSGTPAVIMALGSTFSTLEVVPLVLIGFEGYENMTLNRARPWVRAYHWPINCFIAVAFWNLVGAGLFGFLINTPIALYYMQGLNTTPVHAHTALFGVYGMLGLGLMLFCLKGLTAKRVWRTGVLSFAFWAINVGLGLTVMLSVLPLGLLQAWASVEYGMWYARSAEFMQTDLMNTLRWMRVVGDATFSAGVVALAWFLLGLKTGWSLSPRREMVMQNEDDPAAEQAGWEKQKWD